MSIVLAVSGLAFAAFAVWLTVRIVNRREKWAKRLAIGLTVALIYPLSFGPVMWIHSRTRRGGKTILVVYSPVVWLSYQPAFFHAASWWVLLGASNSPGGSGNIPHITDDADIGWSPE